MRKTLFSACLGLFFMVSGLSAFNQMTLIDTPTPDTLMRGYYDVYFSSYEAGGIKFKVAIGLADRLTLGISEDVGGAIGDGKPQWNIPGVLAKINIFKLEESKLGWAIGYDNFVEGEYGKVVIETNSDGSPKRNEIVYGVYSAFSLPIGLFTGSFFSFGTRYPLLPVKMEKDMADLTFYAGINLGLNNEVRINAEIENFSFGKTENSKLLANAALKYVAGDVLSVSLNFRYLFEEKSLSRSINIEYQNLFY